LTTDDGLRGKWSASPYLHLIEGGIYNPHTGRTLSVDDPRHPTLRRLAEERSALAELDGDQRDLAGDGWLVADGDDLSRRYRLRYVSLETHTVCTQACSFCPVSIAPRKPEYMPTELFESLVAEIATHSDALEGVTLNNYNEPTADRRFVDQVRTLLDHELPVAVLSNGSTFTPDKVDALVEMGPITYLSVNISGLDRERYAAQRQRDHLEMVLEHLDYMRDRPVAETMDLVVLGHQDEQHRADTAELAERFAGSRFNVRDFAIMDRAGYLSFGLKPEEPHSLLRGCDNLGSRPIEHIHINPRGQCILCCEDYDEHHVIGDLTRQSLHEVMTGDEIARLRRTIYGLEEAPAEFICRKCVFALGGK
jgi:MoaA/NifB/PqqE/SkfB family radical SAM enzyme